jgi:hypothetical protein
MVSKQSYISARKWFLVVNSHLAVGHLFLAAEGLKEVPTGPCSGARHTPQPGWPTSSGTWGGGGTPVPLRSHPSNRSHGAEEKSYCRWKISERCQLRRRTATVRLLCDAVFFLTARRRHLENLKEMLASI